MTVSSTAVKVAANTTRSTTLYNMVWKWHFFAALYVLPFMALLSITGGLYLFNNSIEEIIYKDRINVQVEQNTVDYQQQTAAVIATADELKIRSITTPAAQGRATLIEYQDDSRTRSYAWVNPYTGKVIDTQERDSTFMRTVRKLHGELLLGEVGTKFVELAAHWAIVLFVTGLYLWWPRGARTWTKALSLPKGKGRQWWKQTHLFTGLLASLLIIPILITGLPWTDVWGGIFDKIQERTGQSSPSRAFGGPPILSTQSSGQTLSYEAVIDIAKAAGAPSPYEIRPPKNSEAAFFVQSAIDSRTDRVELHIDQYSGEVINRVDFEDYPLLAAGTSLGIAFHQGELYGLVNKLQNLLAATLGLLLAISGFIAWWKRRPKGSLGVPPAPESKSLGIGMAITVIALMVFLPLMAASLIVVLILDKLLFSRLGWFQAEV